MGKNVASVNPGRFNGNEVLMIVAGLHMLKHARKEIKDDVEALSERFRAEVDKLEDNTPAAITEDVLLAAEWAAQCAVLELIFSGFAEVTPEGFEKLVEGLNELDNGARGYSLADVLLQRLRDEGGPQMNDPRR